MHPVARLSRVRRSVSVLATVGLLATLVYCAGRHWEPPPLPGALPLVGGGGPAGCVVSLDGHEVRLDAEQAANAATIAAVGVRLSMPDRGVVVALATAMQESQLRNLPHLGERNDHDSLGLFQQRPSQGWGTEEQVRDPRYAAERFYLALREVPGWQEMRVTDAAQRVQRSAFPEAYEKWAKDATVLATALLGRAGAALSCRIADPPRGARAPEAVVEELERDWGDQVDALTDHTGLSVDADDPAVGWRYAHWLVAHAANLGITSVHFADRSWSAVTGTWSPAGSQRDHVRAEVVTGA